jgi:hypothetical protein
MVGKMSRAVATTAGAAGPNPSPPIVQSKRPVPPPRPPPPKVSYVPGATAAAITVSPGASVATRKQAWQPIQVTMPANKAPPPPPKRPVFIPPRPRVTEGILERAAQAAAQADELRLKREAAQNQLKAEQQRLQKEQKQLQQARQEAARVKAERQAAAAQAAVESRQRQEQEFQREQARQEAARIKAEREAVAMQVAEEKRKQQKQQELLHKAQRRAEREAAATRAAEEQRKQQEQELLRQQAERRAVERQVARTTPTRSVIDRPRPTENMTFAEQRSEEERHECPRRLWSLVIPWPDCPQCLGRGYVLKTKGCRFVDEIDRKYAERVQCPCHIEYQLRRFLPSAPRFFHRASPPSSPQQYSPPMSPRLFHRGSPPSSPQQYSPPMSPRLFHRGSPPSSPQQYSPPSSPSHSPRHFYAW